jgi:predicted secreted protein
MAAPSQMVGQVPPCSPRAEDEEDDDDAAGSAAAPSKKKENAVLTSIAITTMRMDLFLKASHPKERHKRHRLVTVTTTTTTTVSDRRLRSQDSVLAKLLEGRGVFCSTVGRSERYADVER